MLAHATAVSLRTSSSRSASNAPQTERSPLADARKPKAHTTALAPTDSSTMLLPATLTTSSTNVPATKPPSTRLPTLHVDAALPKLRSSVPQFAQPIRTSANALSADTIPSEELSLATASVLTSLTRPDPSSFLTRPPMSHSALASLSLIPLLATAASTEPCGKQLPSSVTLLLRPQRDASARMLAQFVQRTDQPLD